MRFVRASSALLLVTSSALLLACAKRADEAPAETAASQAAPGAAPAPPPAAVQPEAPTSIDKSEDGAEAKGLSGARQEPTTIAEAEAAFEQAKKDIELWVGPLDADKATGGQAPAPLAQGDQRCPRACKAFASLERAGEAICRLAGATDARCTKAKDLIANSEKRVAGCGCED